jgi:hypothetical protein
VSFKFSPEVRLGELVAAIAIVCGGVGVWTSLNSDVSKIKEAQAVQVQTNREMRQEFREVAVEIKGDIRDLRQEIRGRSRPM